MPAEAGLVACGCLWGGLSTMRFPAEDLQQVAPALGVLMFSIWGSPGMTETGLLWLLVKILVFSCFCLIVGVCWRGGQQAACG